MNTYKTFLLAAIVLMSNSVIGTLGPGINEPRPSFANCPDDNFRPYRLEEFAFSHINTAQAEGNFETSGFTTLGGLGYVELQEITSSQFLDPNVTYYVPDPPLLIHGVGEGIDVVIPSNTTIVLAEDWDYGIVVYGGANVCFGESAPQYNEPNAIYESNDTNNPVPPVWVIGESGSPFFNNFCGIFIDRTAGTRCKLDNIYCSTAILRVQPVDGVIRCLLVQCKCGV